MPNYIEDYPWLNIPDFEEQVSKLTNNFYLGICVRYTNRLNMELNITSDGKIILKCPADSSIEEIQNFITSEEKWIRDTLDYYYMKRLSNSKVR